MAESGVERRYDDIQTQMPLSRQRLKRLTSRTWATGLGNIGPWRTRAQPLEDACQELTVIDPLFAAPARQQKQPDPQTVGIR